MSREFIVAHYQSTGDAIIIFIDTIVSVTQHDNETLIDTSSHSYCVSESIADIMRKLNTGHCRIVNK